jgi:hypothetical protein
VTGLCCQRSRSVSATGGSEWVTATRLLNWAIIVLRSRRTAAGDKEALGKGETARSHSPYGIGPRFFLRNLFRVARLILTCPSISGGNLLLTQRTSGT